MKGLTKLAINIFTRLEAARHKAHFLEWKLRGMVGYIDSEEMVEYVAETQRAIETTAKRCKVCNSIYEYTVPRAQR